MSHFKIVYSLSDDGVQSYTVHHKPSNQDWITYKTYAQADRFVSEFEKSKYDCSQPMDINKDQELDFLTCYFLAKNHVEYKDNLNNIITLVVSDV